MADLTIEHQNEIIVNCLLSAAGYFSRDEKKKKKDKEVKPEMNPLACLRLVNERVNQDPASEVLHDLFNRPAARRDEQV